MPENQNKNIENSGTENQTKPNSNLVVKKRYRHQQQSKKKWKGETKSKPDWNSIKLQCKW